MVCAHFLDRNAGTWIVNRVLNHCLQQLLAHNRMTVELLQVLERNKCCLRRIVEHAGLDLLTKPFREGLRQEDLKSHATRADVRLDSFLLSAGELAVAR